MTATPLDAARHRLMRIGPLPDFAHASRQSHAILGWSEIALAAADYPLALLKHAETGQFNLVALYGFEPDRNLYVTGSRWRATYIPENSLRYPFFSNAAGLEGVAIDEDSELIGAFDGQRLFDDTGRPTAYTSKIADALHDIRQDFDEMRQFVDALLEFKLVRPLPLVLCLSDGTESRIDGLYGIDDQIQFSLSDAAVVALHRSGHLQAISILIASLAQLHRLQQLHNTCSEVTIRRVELSFEYGR